MMAMEMSEDDDVGAHDQDGDTLVRRILVVVAVVMVTTVMFSLIWSI